MLMENRQITRSRDATLTAARKVRKSSCLMSFVRPRSSMWRSSSAKTLAQRPDWELLSRSRRAVIETNSGDPAPTASYSRRHPLKLLQRGGSPDNSAKAETGFCFCPDRRHFLSPRLRSSPFARGNATPPSYAFDLPPACQSHLLPLVCPDPGTSLKYQA